MNDVTQVKIVVVEDDVWQREQHCRVLEKAGYTVFGVGHAAAAIDVIDDVKPDVIILDILLTGSTAFSLLHELQSHDDLGKIPIIICSSIEDIDANRLSDYGVRRVLNKTKMSPDDVVVAVRSLLA